MPNEYIPFQFQSDTVAWLAAPRSNGFGHKADPLCGLIGHEMGLGKTAIALLALRPSIKEQRKRILFLVPGATVIQWQRNWDRWINDCESDEFGTDGLFALRSSTGLIPNGMSCIASHSMMAKADFVQSIIRANFDGVVLDEGHKFGGRDTKRIKHLWAARNCSASHFKHARIVLTGTPVRNYADEIYNLLHLIAPDSFKDFPKFASKYLTYDQRALWNVAQFHSDVAPFYTRKTVAEVQKDLPKHRVTKVYCEITDPYIKSLYNKELDLLDNVLNGGGKMSGGEDEGTTSLLGYLIKLRHWTGIAKAKEPPIVEEIVDYLESDNQHGFAHNGNKVAVGLIHRMVADRLEKSILNHLPSCAIFRVQGGLTPSEKDAALTGFRNHQGPAVILMNMEAGGAGIDGLQEVCSRSYVFERMWNGADELQFEKRISRTGQKFATETGYTIAQGTIDEFFDDLVEEKRKITGNVEDRNWETDGKFMRQLAERVCMGRLK